MSSFRSKIWNLIAFGSLGPVNDSGTVQTAQASIGYSEVQDARTVVGLFGIASNPPVGSDVLIVYAGGDRSKGVIIGVNHQASRPTGQESGATTLFDNFENTIKLNSGGVTVAAANGKNVIVNGNNLTVTIQNEGSISAEQGMSITAGTTITLTAPVVNVVGVLQVNGVVVEVP